MADHVYKTVELVGSSTTSFDEAVRTAITRASATLRQLRWTAMRPGMRISYSFACPHGGSGRAERGQEILATSRGALWGYQGAEPLGWFEVVDTRGQIEDGKIAHWQVTVKVGFTLE